MRRVFRQLGLMQELLFRGRLSRLSRVGYVPARGAARECLADSRFFDRVYRSMVHGFIDQRGVKEAKSEREFQSCYESGELAYTMDGETPILTSLLEFFKWLYESGALEFLIGLLMAGAAFQAAVNGPEHAAIFVETTSDDGRKPDAFCVDSALAKILGEVPNAAACFRGPPTKDAVTQVEPQTEEDEDNGDEIGSVETDEVIRGAIEGFGEDSGSPDEPDSDTE